MHTIHIKFCYDLEKFCYVDDQSSSSKIKASIDKPLFLISQKLHTNNQIKSKRERGQRAKEIDETIDENSSINRGDDETMNPPLSSCLQEIEQVNKLLESIVQNWYQYYHSQSNLFTNYTPNLIRSSTHATEFVIKIFFLLDI